MQVPPGWLFSAALTYLLSIRSSCRSGAADDGLSATKCYSLKFLDGSPPLPCKCPSIHFAATYPGFNPKPSDVRVNVHWSMRLIFSLSEALLATLVQQWVRVYFQVFPRIATLSRVPDYARIYAKG